MEASHLVAFNFALFVAIISPGPAFLVAMRNTLSSGKRAGVATGIGLGLAGAFWTGAALLGLDALFTSLPWTYAGIKVAGAIYLLYIAYCMWRGALVPVAVGTKPASHAFRQGVAINALNPKTVLFAAAILAVIFPSNLSLAESFAIVANHLLFEFAFYSILAFGLSRQSVRENYFAAKQHIDRVGALALAGLGGTLFFNR